MFIFQIHINTRVESSEKVNFLYTSSSEAGEYYHIAPRSTHSIAGISWGITGVSPMSVDHRHASPVHGVNKAVNKDHWNRVP